MVVHGVDFLDTQQVGSMFTIPGQNPKRFVRKIQWINESNCLIEFFTPEFTEIALKELTSREPKAEEEQTLWIDLKPYEVFEIRRHLSARFATKTEL